MCMLSLLQQLMRSLHVYVKFGFDVGVLFSADFEELFGVD